MCFCYKIVYSQIHLDSCFTFTNAGPTLGHSLNLKASAPRLDSKRYSFAYRISIVWNNLKKKLFAQRLLLELSEFSFGRFVNNVDLLLNESHLHLILFFNGRLEIASSNRNYYIYAKKNGPACIAAYWKMRYLI